MTQQNEPTVPNAEAAQSDVMVPSERNIAVLIGRVAVAGIAFMGLILAVWTSGLQSTDGGEYFFFHYSASFSGFVYEEPIWAFLMAFIVPAGLASLGMVWVESRRPGPHSLSLLYAARIAGGLIVVASVAVALHVDPSGYGVFGEWPWKFLAVFLVPGGIAIGVLLSAEARLAKKPALHLALIGRIVGIVWLICSVAFGLNLFAYATDHHLYDGFWISLEAVVPQFAIGVLILVLAESTGSSASRDRIRAAGIILGLVVLFSGIALGNRTAEQFEGTSWDYLFVVLLVAIIPGGLGILVTSIASVGAGISRIAAIAGAVVIAGGIAIGIRAGINSYDEYYTQFGQLGLPIDLPNFLLLAHLPVSLGLLIILAHACGNSVDPAETGTVGTTTLAQ